MATIKTKVKSYRKSDGTKVKPHKRSSTKARNRVASRRLRSDLDDLLRGQPKPYKPKSRKRLIKSVKRDLNKLVRTAKRRNKRASR